MSHHDLRRPRALHPGAWWLWAVSLAVAASTTTNPVILVLVISVAALVVAARRTDSPWARAFRLYVMLGVVIIGVRVVLHVLIGSKVGEIPVISLPSVALPQWAAGIQIGGQIWAEGLLAAAVEGLRLATMVIVVGAANALANPKRLLRALPAALHEIGAALVVAVSVAPQLAESVQRVRRARGLRGSAGGGLRAVSRVALPVLTDTLERSIQLAASMDSRGYGRANLDGPAAHRAHRLGSAAALVSLLLVSLGLYGVLDDTVPRPLGVPVLLLGLGLAVASMVITGRAVRRTRYRPDPWAVPEWVTVGCGLVAAVTMLAVAQVRPDALVMPLAPLGWPQVPLAAMIGIAAAAIPAVATPPPPVEHRSPRRTGRARPACATASETMTSARSVS